MDGRVLLLLADDGVGTTAQGLRRLAEIRGHPSLRLLGLPDADARPTGLVGALEREIGRINKRVVLVDDVASACATLGTDEVLRTAADQRAGVLLLGAVPEPYFRQALPLCGAGPCAAVRPTLPARL